MKTLGLGGTNKQAALKSFLELSEKVRSRLESAGVREEPSAMLSGVKEAAMDRFNNAKGYVLGCERRCRCVC